MIPLTQHSSRNGRPIVGIVIHYSVGNGNAREIMEYFRDNPKRRASYHYAIGRDGQAEQGVADDRAAWQAAGIATGDDRYIPKKNNRETIGVCLANWGHAVPSGGTYAYSKVVGRTKRWEEYTEAQYLALRAVVMRLKAAHPTIKYITGHEDHTHGKSDPGPVFQWRELNGTGLIRAWNQWSDGEPQWRYMRMR